LSFPFVPFAPCAFCLGSPSFRATFPSFCLLRAFRASRFALVAHPSHPSIYHSSWFCVTPHPPRTPYPAPRSFPSLSPRSVPATRYVLDTFFSFSDPRMQVPARTYRTSLTCACACAGACFCISLRV
jgi:hypothetical protein